MLKNIISLFSVGHILKKTKIIGNIPSTKTAYKTVFSLSWPSVVESVLVSVVGAVDTMMVGGLGHGAITAVGITNQPKFVLIAVIMSLNVGVTAISARRKGENDIFSANNFLRQSILYSVTISAILAISGFLSAKYIISLAGAKKDILDLSVAYYQILMFSIFFTGISLTINAAQRGVGNTKISMRSNAVANIVNLIGNYFLINGIWIFPKLGVRGAAIATAFGSLIGCIMSILSLFPKDNFLTLRKKYPWTVPISKLKSFFSIVASSAAEQLFMRIGFFTFAVIVAKLGNLPMAVHIICMHLISFSFCFGDGIGIGTGSLLGQSLGEKRYDKAILYGNIGQRIAFLVSTALFFFYIVFRNQLIYLFNNEAEILELGSKIVVIIAFTTHFQTSQAVFLNCLRVAGDNKFTAFISLISVGIIRPLFAYIFCYGMNMGLIGAWVALFMDQAMRFTLNKIRFKSEKWAYIKI
ncbi:MATE family efflux transporter [Fusobacterium sp. PH5-44]|uniref:MATE family efflux transporter n=1 Tax=unclassified Fusobacterium TaxID=2648384 RepID=UPI003D1DB326